MITTLPSTAELKARYFEACKLQQAVDTVKIEAALRRWLDAIKVPTETKIVRAEDLASAAWAARATRAASAAWAESAASAAWAARAASAAWDARAARAASAAWAARAASAAWAAWAESAARAAWAASAAWAARAASAAWDARAASAAWDARAAWDVSYSSPIVIGASSIGDQVTANIWMPFFEAFEAGAFCLWISNDVCAYATNPKTILVDSENRPHCSTGPAFEWLSDVIRYFWHGTEVPPEWITNPKSLTAEVALKCQNLEQRRAAIDILGGWKAILDHLDHRIIDESGDPLIGTLVEVDLPDLRSPARFLRVLCGTRREFAIGIPPQISSARAAQAWMQNKPTFEPPEVRT